MFHGYNLKIKPKNIFYRNEVQYKDDVPTKKEGRIVRFY